MEWRIIVPVLCLIGILHVSGNAAQADNTTTAAITTNTSQIATRPTNQTATSSQTSAVNQTATSSQTSAVNQTATSSQTAAVNQTATINQATNTSQTATTNPTATINQTTTPATAGSIPATAVSTPAAAATTPAKTASLNVVFRLTQDFKDVYSDLTNPETKRLADDITNAFSPVYKKRFANFLRMIIRSFRKGSVVTDSVLEFDNTNNTSPNVTEVKDTFTDAIKTGNLNFTVDTTSINVADIPTANGTTVTTASTNSTNTSNTTPATTVSTPAAAATTPAKTASLNVVFRLTQDFKDVYSDLTNPETKRLADDITNAFSPVYKKRFANFLRMIIRSFRKGSVVTDSVLEFDNTNNTSPNVTEVKDTFTDAIKTGNLNFTVDTTSINVTDIPTANGTTVTTASTNSTNTSNTTPATTVSTPATTVSTPAAAATTPAKTASLNVVFRLTQDFKDVYSDLTNPETKRLADDITNAFSPVYKKRFANFLRMIIRSFRKGSVVTDSVFEFDNTNSTSPNVTEVKDTFTDAIKTGNFNFTVDTTSINVTDITTNVSTTTQATTTVSTTAGLNLSEYNVTFKMNETFSSELSNINSSQAVALAKNITVQLDGVFKKGFSNFVRSLIWRFRSGSVFVDALLRFNKSGTSPTAAEVVKFIVDSAKNGSFTFTVDSLTVTDPSGTTANRSPVLASMLTALWMTLASLVVSAAMH